MQFYKIIVKSKLLSMQAKVQKLKLISVATTVVCELPWS